MTSTTATLPSPRTARARNPGIVFGLSAYLLWGALPLYLHPLSGRVDALVIVAHRVVWSVALLSILLTALKLWPAVLAVLRTPRTLGMLCLSTLFISTNWFTFTYANTHGHGVDSALGYFVTPILSALIGLLFLKERLGALQWLALTLATAAVAYLTLAQGHLPLIAIVLAITFAMYGLVRKLAPVDALAGLTVETVILLPLAIPFLLHARSANLVGGHPDAQLLAVLILGCSLFTTIPLLLFAKAARLLPLTTIGFLQYVGPTCQFLVSVVVYHETFTPERRVAFPIIWLAIAIFLADAYLRHRRTEIEEPT